MEAAKINPLIKTITLITLIIVIAFTITSCSKDDDEIKSVTADFSTNVVTNTQATVTITNSSQNATSFEWSFPNGTPTSSTDENPTVVYAEDGNYTITLVASNGTDSDTESAEITITGIESAISYEVDFPDIDGYPMVSTGQTVFFDGDEEITITPNEGDTWYGQNANYVGTPSSYTELDNGWVLDNNTGLVWTKEFTSKMLYSEAEAKRDSLSALTDFDWRIPSCKELYSLMNYGTGQANGNDVIASFIDEDLFDIKIGDTSNDEREIDGQVWSSSFYEGLTNNIDEGHLAPNPVDGRIKTYPTTDLATNTDKEYYLLLCAGNINYGINDYTDNADGTITDAATGLMWKGDDGAEIYTFTEALAFAESSEFAGYTDWRIPDVKELQSIVDYSRGPTSAEGLPAIDTDYFTCTPITNTGSAFNPTYGYYWSNTTLSDGNQTNPKVGSEGMYVSFGRALGKSMSGDEIVDWHGAGAARSDAKTLTIEQIGVDPNNILEYNGPQNDERRYYNKIRLVRYAN